MKNKVVDIKTAVSKIHNGDTVMVGAFGGYSMPSNVVFEMQNAGLKDLTLITEGMSLYIRPHISGLRPFVDGKMLKKLVTTFCGDDEVIAAHRNGEFELEFIPQGTMTERIRAGGAGIGGFYVKTGIGTEVEIGKEKKVINGEEYLLELPLRGDVSIVKAYKADKYGNAVFQYTGRNLNLVMATASDTVILEVEEIVEVGEIEPDQVDLPGIFVDYIVKAEVIEP